MNTPTESEITACLSSFQALIHAVREVENRRTKMNDDIVKLEQQIANSGELDYEDNEAVQRLAALQLKQKAAVRSLDASDLKLGPALIELDEQLPIAGRVAADVLQEIADNRLETVTRALEPFSANRAKAREIALQTDACCGAINAVNRYRNTARVLRTYVGRYCADHESHEEYVARAVEKMTPILVKARRIEAVLVEAAKKSPDLLQFLPCQSA